MLAIWLAGRAFRRSVDLRRRAAAALLRIPILGTLLRQAALATGARLAIL